MPLRAARILIIAVLALWVSLVAFGNITDYGTNFMFVQHVMSMDTIFPSSDIHYRAITAPVLHHAAYVLIIAVEAMTALLLWAGAWRMWRRRHAPPSLFARARNLAVAGLALGVLLWLGGFIAIGGEWFGMWMSPQWNGVQSAFRFVVLLLGALVFLAQRDAVAE